MYTRPSNWDYCNRYMNSIKFESREFRGFAATGGGIPPLTLGVVWCSVAPPGVPDKVRWA
jgi:hypothetical protein